MHQQVPHALSNNLRIVRRLLSRIPLRQYSKRPAFPTPHQIATAPVGSTNDPGAPPDSRVTASLLKRLVVTPEIVDIEQCQPDLMGIALRQHPSPLQQRSEVRP